MCCVSCSSLTLDLRVDKSSSGRVVLKRHSKEELWVKVGTERYEVGDTAYLGPTASEQQQHQPAGRRSQSGVEEEPRGYVRIERVVEGGRMVDVRRLELTGRPGDGKELALVGGGGGGGSTTSHGKRKEGSSSRGVTELERLEVGRLRGKFVLLSASDYWSHIKYTQADPAVYHYEAR